MKNKFKSLLLLLVTSFYFLASSILPLSTLAQEEPEPPTPSSTSSWYNQSFEDWFVKVYDDSISPPSEIFGERYTAAQVQWIVYSLVSLPFVAGSELSKDAIACAMSNDLVNCAQVIGDFINSILQSQAIEQTSSLASTITDNPVSGIGYVKNLITKFKIIPETQAQGFGYNNANLSLYLWKITRNIAYTLIVLAVVVMAFMIMFRVKISPQVVISVQSALPKIITTLILITFSYAIAGFLIDLVYVVIGLFASLIVQGGLTTFDFTTMFNSLTSGKNAFTLLFQYWLLFIVAAMGHIFSGAVVGGILTIIFAIVSIIILLFQTIKIMFMFLKTFVNITLLIAFAPIQILAGAFTPNAGFGSWLKAMISNLLVYPVSGLLFFLAFLFLRQVYPDGNGWDSFFVFNVTSALGAETWDPPLTVGTGTGVFDGIWILLMALSFTLITFISKTKDILDSMFSGKPFSFGTAIGAAIGPVKDFARFGFSYKGGALSEEGQEVYRKVDEKQGRKMIKQGELIKSVSNLIK